MKFKSILALALPAAVFGLPQALTSTVTPTPTGAVVSSVSATSSAATPTTTQSLEAICESQAGGYASSCPRCLHLCAAQSDPTDCFFSVFTAVNEEDSDCGEHGGNNCSGRAVDNVCGTS